MEEYQVLGYATVKKLCITGKHIICTAVIAGKPELGTITLDSDYDVFSVKTSDREFSTNNPPSYYAELYSEIRPESNESYFDHRLITLAKYAKDHEVNVATIRQRIRRGIHPEAAKIGGVWYIPSDAPYIDHRRIKM